MSDATTGASVALAPVHVPDPLDLQQQTEETIVEQILAYEFAKGELQQRLPELMAAETKAKAAHECAKRDLNIAKSQIKYCTDGVRSCQSILRTLRPS